VEEGRREVEGKREGGRKKDEGRRKKEREKISPFFLARLQV
jgi:hypothetical protein